MEPRLKEIVSAFDRVFAKNGQAPLLKNAAFIIDDQMSTDSYVRFYSVAKSGRVNMYFELTLIGVTFFIDKTSEMPDISCEVIKKDIPQFEAIIERIFTSVIHATYIGNRVVLSFINAVDNTMTGQFKYKSGLLPSWFRSRVTKIYNPFFED